MSSSAAEAVELTVSLPALDERESLESLLPRLRAALDALGAAYEIVVVDGGSQDGTRETASRLGARVVRQVSPGFGPALREGFEAARGRWVLVMDADGSHPPEKIGELWARRREAGVVIGSRFAPGGSADMPPSRYWMSRALNALNGLLFSAPVRDASSGFRLYRAELVKGLPLRQRDFSAQQEILAHALSRGGTVSEVPFRYAPRLGGESKAQPLRWLPSFARMVVRVAALRRDRAKLLLFPVLAAAAAAYLIGAGFGLPSEARSARVYLPEQRSEAFYRQVEDNRRAYYGAIGDNLQAAFGRGDWAGTLVPPSRGFTLKRYPAGRQPPDPTLMHGFSSFSLRSVEQDEQFVLNSVARFKPRQLDFNPHETLYGGAYIYPLAAWWGALAAVRALHLSHDALDYYRRPALIARLYESGRLFSALWGLLGAVFVFLLAEELYGAAAGVAAAALFAFSPAVVAYAHLLKPHLTGAALAAAALWLGARAVKRRAFRPLYGAAVFYGLAVGAVKTLLPLAAPLALALWLAEEAPAARKLSRLAACAALAAAVFALTNPYAFIYFRDFLDEVRGMARWYHSGFGLESPVRAIGGALKAGLGVGAWAAAALSLGALIRRRSRADVYVLGSLGLLLALTSFQIGASSSDPATARFFLAAIALACVAAAAGAAGSRFWRVVVAAALAVDVVFAAGLDANFRADAPGRSHADAASDWLSASVPAGGELGLGTPAPMVDRFPPLPFSRYTLVYVDGTPDEAQARELPERFLTNALWPLPAGLEGRYRLERSFDLPPGLVFLRDRFTQANPPIAVYRRVEPAR